MSVDCLRDDVDAPATSYSRKEKNDDQTASTKFIWLRVHGFMDVVSMLSGRTALQMTITVRRGRRDIQRLDFSA